MRRVLTPWVVLILQAGGVALAGSVPSTLLDLFLPKGRGSWLDVRAVDLNGDLADSSGRCDADAGNVSAPGAPACARTRKGSGHPASPGIVFDVRRDGGEYRLAYRLDAGAKVEVAIFNAAGQRIETVASGHRAAGQGMISLALGDTAEGVYFARIKVNDEVIVRKFVIAR